MKITTPSVAQSETLQHARLGYANPLECHEGRYAPPQLLHYTAAEARLAARARRWRWSHTLAREREVLRERGVLSSKSPERFGKKSFSRCKASTMRQRG